MHTTADVPAALPEDPHRATRVETGARILVQALASCGIRCLFGIPGTHNIEFYDALASDERITPILVTDEQSAGFMADGHFRSSGQVAALCLVPGAGVTHALSGIAEAFYDQIPLLVVMCAPRHDLRYGFQLHDIDQAALLAPVVKKVLKIQNHQDLWSLTRYAHALALEAPYGPVALEVPAELFFKVEAFDPQQRYPARPVTPHEFSERDYETLLAHMQQARRIGLYLGRGAMMPASFLVQLAERLDALVFTTISGKGVFPERHPRFVWNGMGRALPPPLAHFEAELDCILAIGCRFSEVATASYGFQFKASLLHVDIDPSVFHRNYPATHVLKADAQSLVRRLLEDPRLPMPFGGGSERLKALAEAHVETRQGLLATEDKNGINPTLLFEEIERRWGEDAVFVTDSGNGLFKAMEALRLNRAQSFLAPVDFSCMGYGVPAAIGAKLANPKRPVVAVVGDGALLMTGLEMLTARAYGLGILFVVLNDGKLGQIAQFQSGALGREMHTTVHPLHFPALAQSLGLDYLACQSLMELLAVLPKAQEYCALGRPVLLVAQVDYSSPSYFTKAVIQTNFARLDWQDRWRMVGRILKRKILQ